MGDVIRPHDRIKVEQSLKYPQQEAVKLWSQAGMSEVKQWNHRDEYGKFMNNPGVSTCHLPEQLPLPEPPPTFSGTCDQ